MACTRIIYELLNFTDYLPRVRRYLPDFNAMFTTDGLVNEEPVSFDPAITEPLRQEEGGLILLEERKWGDDVEYQPITSNMPYAPPSMLDDTQAIEIKLPQQRLLSADEKASPVLPPPCYQSYNPEWMNNIELR